MKKLKRFKKRRKKRKISIDFFHSTNYTKIQEKEKNDEKIAKGEKPKRNIPKNSEILQNRKKLEIIGRISLIFRESKVEKSKNEK